MHLVNIHVKNRNSPHGLELTGAAVHNDKMSIEKIRSARALNQVELAELAGVSQATLSRAENLDDGTTLRTMRAIAGALGVPLRDLFDDRPEAERVLIEVFRQLPQDRQELWLQMSRTFAQSPSQPKQETP